MLDLGTSINVIPYFIYKSLKFSPLKEIDVIIWLINWFNTYLEMVVEDILVHVIGLIFLIDFYILNMEDKASTNPTQSF